MDLSTNSNASENLYRGKKTEIKASKNHIRKCSKDKQADLGKA